MAEPQKRKKKKEDEAEKREEGIGVGVLKELTLSFIQHREIIARQINQGAEQLVLTTALVEALQDLDVRVTGASFMLSRINFVFDKMVEIKRGDPDADPPVEGRDVDLGDITAALDEFDREADKAAAEVEKEEATEEAPAEPSMLSQAPPPPRVTDSLPPLPTVEPLKK